MRVGAGIYEHADGRWEARYRKGRRPDGKLIYGSVYGRSYEEAEKKRAELLHELSLRTEKGDSGEAAFISESNKCVREYYAIVPRSRVLYPEPLSETEVENFLPYIRKFEPGIRLAACLALYLGVASEALAALRWSDIDLASGTLTVSGIMVDARHMFGMIVPCEIRTLSVPRVISDFVDLPACVRRGGDSFILTGNAERIKSLRSGKIQWSKILSSVGCKEKATPEVLRATFIRRVLEKGLNFETVSRITGLTTLVIRTKYGKYAGANPELLRIMDDFVRPEERKTRQMNLLILGAGSHGHAVYEIAERLGIFHKIAFLDDTVTGENVIGKLDDFLRYRDEYPACFIAIGNNELRRKLAQKVTEAGFLTPRLISGETSVARGVCIGRGSIVMPQATINAGARIGEFCIIASNALVGFNSTIGSYAHCECASVVLKDCCVPQLATVESGEIVRNVHNEE